MPGYENKVKSNLASRVRSMNVEDRIYEVVIPMEDVIEFKNGRKVVVQKKVFPGYLLVRMGLDDDAWYVVRNTPGVTGFVGSGAKPTPLSRKEVEDILGTGEKIEGPQGEKKVRPRLEYEVSEQVRVVTGPFADFNGVISRDRRRPLEAQGAREHLRTRDPGRARVRRRRQALTAARTTREQEEHSNGKAQSRRDREDPDPGRCGNARAAGRNRARPARHQHHGLLQGVQRHDGEAQRGHDHSGRDHDLRGPHVHVRHQDAADPGADHARRPGSRRASTAPQREMVGTITSDQVRQIAETKMPDLNAIDLEGAMAQVAGTARSMGIEVSADRRRYGARRRTTSPRGDRPPTEGASKERRAT